MGFRFGPLRWFSDVCVLGCVVLGFCVSGFWFWGLGFGGLFCCVCCVGGVRRYFGFHFLGFVFALAGCVRTCEFLLSWDMNPPRPRISMLGVIFVWLCVLGPEGLTPNIEIRGARGIPMQAFSAGGGVPILILSTVWGLCLSQSLPSCLLLFGVLLSSLLKSAGLTQ